MAEKPMQALVDMNAEELSAQAVALREELFDLRFKNKMRHLDNPIRIRSVRRQIARVETLLSRQRRQSLEEKAR